MASPTGLTLYTAGTPNGYKVTVLLEELGLAYEKEPSFVEISPNGRIPALVDHDNKGLALFESGNIMLYLAERHGKGRFLGQSDAERYSVTGWLFWQMSALGPTLGQLFQFTHAIKPLNKVPLDRFKLEATRLFGVMEAALTKHQYLAGEAYSIADMSCLPWVAASSVSGMSIYDYPHLANWAVQLLSRPEVRQGMDSPPTQYPPLRENKVALLSGNREAYNKIVDDVRAAQAAAT
ncbi:MAG: hypothetical protein WDW36_000615 [Sanguina aurantia]